MGNKIFYISHGNHMDHQRSFGNPSPTRVLAVQHMAGGVLTTHWASTGSDFIKAAHLILVCSPVGGCLWPQRWHGPQIPLQTASFNSVRAPFWFLFVFMAWISSSGSKLLKASARISHWYSTVIPGNKGRNVKWVGSAHPLMNWGSVGLGLHWFPLFRVPLGL